MDQGGPAIQAHQRGAADGISDFKVYSGVESVSALGGYPIPADHPLSRQGSFPRAIYRIHELSRPQEFLIRSLDIAGAALILLVTAPIVCLFSILVKILSPGPILYKQERVGRQGRLFTLYKFRSMIEDAERHVGPVWADQEDDRVTSIGRVMRKMRIDELPQLINVLKGDMSLVGPRPERPFFVNRHKALQGVRLAVRPGLTGLAQIRAFYDLRPEHKLKYDYLYIQNRSLLLNLSILLKTIPVVIRKTGW